MIPSRTPWCIHFPQKMRGLLNGRRFAEQSPGEARFLAWAWIPRQRRNYLSNMVMAHCIQDHWCLKCCSFWRMIHHLIMEHGPHTAQTTTKQCGEISGMRWVSSMRYFGKEFFLYNVFAFIQSYSIRRWSMRCTGVIASIHSITAPYSPIVSQPLGILFPSALLEAP